MADHHAPRLNLEASLQLTGEADFWHPRRLKRREVVDNLISEYRSAA